MGAPLFPAARLHLHGDEVALVQADLVVVVLVVVIVVVVPPVVVIVGYDAKGEWDLGSDDCAESEFRRAQKAASALKGHSWSHGPNYTYRVV